MTIVLRHNSALELNLVEYRGSVTVPELRGLADFSAANRKLMLCDCLSVVLPGADFRTVALADIRGIFDYYAKLFAPLDLQILRRSAWLCLSAAGRQHTAYWTRERDARPDLSSDVRQFASLAEAGDWLVLSRAEIDMVERGEGFIEVSRVHAPAQPHAAAL